MHTVKAIEENSDNSDEENNVLLMLSSSTAQTNGEVEISPLLGSRKGKAPACVVIVNTRRSTFWLILALLSRS